MDKRRAVAHRLAGIAEQLAVFDATKATEGVLYFIGNLTRADPGTRTRLPPLTRVVH